MTSRKTDVYNNQLNDDSGQNSKSDGGTSKTFKTWAPKEGRTWFRQRLIWKTTIGMPEFCERFVFTCEQDAHEAFSKLLSDNQLPLSSRTAADTAYQMWKRNEGERFWASQVTDYRVDISTTKTEGDLVDRSQFFASQRLRSRDDSKGSSSTSRLSSGIALKTNAGAAIDSSTAAPVPKRTVSEAALETAEEERPTKVLFVEAELSSASGSDYVRSTPSSARSSLNSIDFKFIDHLVGPGTTSSRLNTDNRLTISDVDVSLAMMEKRRTLLKKQSEINDVSDLLTLNFIFDEAWIKRNLSAEVARHLLPISPREVPDEERLVLLDCSEFAASHTFQETKDLVLKKINGKERTITGEVLRGLTERANMWLQSNSYPTPPPSTLPQNEDTYAYATMKNIVFGTLHDLDILDHWGRDSLPVPVGWEERYEPDYYGEYLGFPFVLVEIKKSGANDDELEGDLRKLPCMGKLMVDRMVRAGVPDPKIIAFLVKESRCEISMISLDYEAMYVNKPIGAFELPCSNLQLPLLIPGQRLLHFVRRTAEATLTSIKNRSGRPSILRWIRPSYYVKGNRIPVSKKGEQQPELIRRKGVTGAVE